MPAFICTACGTQYEPSDAPPARCPVCDDERQFVPPGGQSWTTLDALRRSHFNAFRRHEPGLLGVSTFPAFGIGQRALLVRTPGGSVLWDCVALIDDATVEIVGALGGLRAIAVSHPHYYTTVAEWSRAFGGVPVHLHAADRRWVMRPDPAIRFWEGDSLEVGPGLTLLRGGGHFAGAAVLHWAGGAGGRGALLTADTAQVAQDRRHLAFMRSYPNYLPLPAAAVRRLADRLASYPFDAIYGAFWDSVIAEGGKRAFDASVRRHVAAVEGTGEAAEW